MKLSKILLSIAFGLAIPASIIATSDVRMDGAEVGEWTMDFDAAKALASEKGLPMMLNFTGSDWCIWCKRMEAQVFSKDAWKSYAADKIILVTLDFPRNKSVLPEIYRKRNDKLKDRFGIRGFPTYVVLESDGKTKLGQLGAGTDKTAESFIEEFEGIMKMSSAYLEALSNEDPAKAKALKAAINEFKSAKKEMDDWIATRPPRTPENEKLFEGFAKRVEAAHHALVEF